MKKRDGLGTLTDDLVLLEQNRWYQKSHVVVWGGQHSHSSCLTPGRVSGLGEREEIEALCLKCILMKIFPL